MICHTCNRLRLKTENIQGEQEEVAVRPPTPTTTTTTTTTTTPPHPRCKGSERDGPADGGWGGDGQVLDLEEHVDVGRELDALAVGQAQHLVVVQHRVHVLDPQGVHRPVADDPLVVLCRVLVAHTHTHTSGIQRERKDTRSHLLLCYSQQRGSEGEKRHTQLLVSLLQSTEGFRG